MMRTKAVRFILCLALICVILTALAVSASAAGGDSVRYTNSFTGFQAVILDELDLLSDAEEEMLKEYMIPITEYGNIAFWSTDEYTSYEISQAKSKRYSLFGDSSSGILSINMKVRYITFQSDGRIYSAVSESNSRSVTDNASGYASRGDFYGCAVSVYEQVGALLKGDGISEPMKYTSYIFIALMLAFVIIVGVAFSALFNPLARRNKQQAVFSSSGSLAAGPVRSKVTNTYIRAWWRVLLFILSAMLRSGGGGFSGGGSSGGGSSGGGSSGGGGGGSSRF